MIRFRKPTLIGRIQFLLWPPYRHAQDEKLYQAIQTLIENPQFLCIVGNTYIPSGDERLNKLI